MTDSITAYVTRARLIRELSICDRTLDNWIARGFPRAGRNGKWKWTTVSDFMDGPATRRVPSGAASQWSEAEKLERMKNASATHYKGKNVR